MGELHQHRSGQHNMSYLINYGMPLGITNDSWSPSSPQAALLLWKTQVQPMKIIIQRNAPIPDRTTSEKEL